MLKVPLDRDSIDVAAAARRAVHADHRRDRTRCARGSARRRPDRSSLLNPNASDLLPLRKVGDARALSSWRRRILAAYMRLGVRIESAAPDPKVLLSPRSLVRFGLPLAGTKT